MEKAKAGGYTGPDFKYQIGWILHDTNYYAVIFREDFAKAIWGEEVSVWRLPEFDELPPWKLGLQGLLEAEDKWKYLEVRANLTE